LITELFVYFEQSATFNILIIIITGTTYSIAMPSKWTNGFITRGNIHRRSGLVRATKVGWMGSIPDQVISKTWKTLVYSQPFQPRARR